MSREAKVYFGRARQMTFKTFAYKGKTEVGLEMETKDGLAMVESFELYALLCRLKNAELLNEKFKVYGIYRLTNRVCAPAADVCVMPARALDT